VLIDEAAGQSGANLTDDGVTFNGTALTVSDGTLYFLRIGDWFRVTGSTFNDGDYQVSNVLGVDPEGQEVTIMNATFITENATGQDVTIEKRGRPTIRIMKAAPCNDLLLEANRLTNIGQIALEIFPKKMSDNLKVIGNTIVHSGHLNTAGTGIKAGQFYRNALITGNQISDGNMGMNIGNWDSARYTNNIITNCQKYGIAITISDHLLMPIAPFGSLTISNNTIAFTISPHTGQPFVATRPHQPAINLNGLARPRGPVEISYNMIYKWGAEAEPYAGRGGIQINKSVVDMQHIHIHHNTLFDSGGFLVSPLENWFADILEGSDTITNVTYDRPDVPTAEPPLIYPPKQTTAGWYPGMVVVHPLLPVGTTIQSIDSGENKMILDKNANGSATYAKIRSGYPRDLRLEYNRFWSSQSVAALAPALMVRAYIDGGRIIGNTIRRFGEYPLQVNGTEAWIEDNIIMEPNFAFVPNSNRGPIFLGTVNEQAGIYHVNNNHLDLGENGHASYLVNSTNAGTLYMARNETNGYLPATISGGKQPSLLPWLEGVRPIGVATAAPTGPAPSPSGLWAVGTLLRCSTPPTITCPIEGWHCVQSGNPGLWVSFGGIGIGTTAQATALSTPSPPNPARLTISEKMFFINTTANQLWCWNGTAWKNVATLT